MLFGRSASTPREAWARIVLMRRMKQPVFPGGTPAWLARIAEALDRLHDVVQPRDRRTTDLAD